MQYIPGVIGATAAKLFGEAPEQQVSEDLRRFKQLMEAGEVVQSEATARGRGQRNRRQCRSDRETLQLHRYPAPVRRSLSCIRKGGT